MTDPGATPAAPQAVEHCYRHPDRETRIHCTRCDRPICPDCMIPAAVGFQCPDDVKQGNADVRQARTRFGGVVREGNPVVTYAILGINVAVFLLSLAGASITNVTNGKIFLQLQDNPYAIDLGHQYYRLLTSAFLHFNIIHIGLNMYCLILLGPQLEQILGRLRYAGLYLVSALGGGVAVYVVNSAGAGASGAIFGLFAGYFVIARRVGADTGQIVTTIGLNLAFTFLVPGISKAGHIGGLITGAVVAAALVYVPHGPRRDALQAGGVAVVLAVLAVLTFTHSSDVPADVRRQICGVSSTGVPQRCGGSSALRRPQQLSTLGITHTRVITGL